MRNRIGLLMALAGLLGLSACGGDRDADSPATDAADAPPTVVEPAEETSTEPWAVASANPLATEAGANILESGGSAIDAAIAVQAVLGLVEPQSSGLGGGAFMIYYDAETGALTAYDGREIAPASATPTMFLGDDGEPMGFYDAVVSGRSVGVPGVVAMMGLAHDEHGSLPWADLFTEAEELARAGFDVSPRLASLIERFGERLGDNDRAQALFFDEEGTPKAVGARVVNTAYAETLSLLREGGAEAFYEGVIADQIISAVNEKAGEGTMVMADFEAYEATTRPVVCGPFTDYQICSMGPPSSGGVTVIQILGLLERSLAEGASEGDLWPRYVEASRLAYADRALYLADPRAMTDGNITSDVLVEALIAPSYLDARATLIGDSAAETVEAGDPLAALGSEDRAADASPELPGTSHFSVRDADGNIVSMTTTVEFAFGSHLMAGGMILNNQLTDFSFLPERDGIPVANAAGPGKKPRSSMSPVIVLDAAGNPTMAIGSPGGPAIIGYVAKTLVGALMLDMPLQEAVEMSHIVVPRGQVFVEEETPAEIIEALEGYGFEVRSRSLGSGLYGFRIHTDGELEGAADPRREGTFMMAPVTE